VPAAITVPATSQTGSYTVSWASSTGASSYDLEEDTSSSFANPTLVYSGANPTFDVTGKTSGTFYYRVSAANGAGASGWTQGGNGLTIVAPPAPPTLTVPAASQPGTYTVTWAGFSGAILYDLEEDTTAAFTNPTLLVSSANTSHTVHARANGTWYYRVRAVNGAGPSPWTTDTTGCTVTLAAPFQPASITVPSQSSTGGFTVSWTASAGAATYELEESTDSSFASAVPLVYSGALTSHLVSGLSNGTYWYRVRSVNSAGNSNWTTSTNGCAVSLALPAVPAAITVPATSQTGSYTVSWLSSPGATRYELEEALDASFTSPQRVYTGAATFFDVASRTDGTYFYRVRALNAVGSSPWATDTQGCAVTAMTASVLVRAGTANPADGVELPGAVDVPLLHVECAAGLADGVLLQSLTVHVSGTGDDAVDIVSVGLWEDVDGDGRPGSGDALIATDVFSGDDGAITFDLTSMPAIPAGGDIRFVVVCEFSAYILSGNTFRATLNPVADVVAVSAGFSVPLTPGGLAVVGGEKRIETSGAGSLQLSLGANTPVGGTFSAPTSGVNMMQALLAASSLEDVAVSRIRLTGIGTGIEDPGVTAHLWEDADGDGTVSTGDTELASASFAGDNGTVDFTGLALVVGAGSTLHLIVTCDFGTDVAPGTYSVAIETGEAVEAAGETSRLGVIAGGAPVSGASMEIVIPTTSEASYFMGGCSGEGNSPMHWAGYLLLLSVILITLKKRREVILD
jgi:hypothetical protein